MSKQLERYVVEIVSPDQNFELDYSDLDSAAQRFYTEVANNYDEPSYEVALHDLVAGETLAAWSYEPNDAIGLVHYNVETPVLGN